MPAQIDSTIGATRDSTVAALEQRLRTAVDSGSNSNGRHAGEAVGSNGAIQTPPARDVAIDVCRAILAEAGAGTAEHSDDVVLITEAIGERMGLSGAEAEDLLVAARLHDIGKVWVPNGILEKAGPLTSEEWKVMRQHTLVGQEILSPVAELSRVGRLVRHSHERWDGAGYPDGVKGADIPLGSRIIFCADTFHAIRSDRPYRAGRSADEALAEIGRCAGTQFDPKVAAALEEVVHDRRRRPRGVRSTRLFALLMCLVIGGAGTALARSDLLGAPGAAPPPAIPAPPPGCGTAECPSVAAPVGGLGPVEALGSSSTGPRVRHPGLPSRVHGRIAHAKRAHRNAASGHREGESAKSDRAAKGKSEGNGNGNGNGRARGHS